MVHNRELFRTEFTEEGVIPIFENLGNFINTDVLRLNPISFDEYRKFINSELLKLQGKAEVFDGTIQTRHSNRYVSLTIVQDSDTYQITKILKRVWIDFFMSQYETVRFLSS